MNNGSFERRVRNALHNAALQADFQPRRVPPRTRSARYGLPALVAVASIGLLGVGLAFASRDTDSSDVSLTESSRPAPTLPIESDASPSTVRLVGLPQASAAEWSPPQLAGIRRLAPTYWFGALAAPSGGVVSIAVDPFANTGSTVGDTPLAEVGDSSIALDQATASELPIGCGTATVTLASTVTATERRDLQERLTVMEGGGLRVAVPSGWTSFGGGYASPTVNRTVRIESDGELVEIQIAQQFDTPPGARAYDPAYRAIGASGRDILVLFETATSSSVAISVDGDAVTLRAEMPAEDLADLAVQLQLDETFTLPSGYSLPGASDPAEVRCPTLGM